jgi:hypothetical protein
LPKKKADTSVIQAVDAYLGGIRLEGAQNALAAVARLLAASLEEAPGYARARLAHELRDLLTELGAQVDQENNLEARREQRRRDRAWAAGE